MFGAVKRTTSRTFFAAKFVVTIFLAVTSPLMSAENASTPASNAVKSKVPRDDIYEATSQGEAVIQMKPFHAMRPQSSRLRPMIRVRTSVDLSWDKNFGTIGIGAKSSLKRAVWWRSEVKFRVSKKTVVRWIPPYSIAGTAEK